MSLFQKKEPETVMVLGQTLHCGICQHTRFWHREGQLHTGVATFFQLEWINPTAHCYVCEHCGYIYWFLPPKDEES